MSNPRIKHLMFYPVKSAAGMEVQNAILTEAGLQVHPYADHQFMVVRTNPDGQGVYHFVTQRDKRNSQDKPQGLSIMALIKPALVGNTLQLTWNHQDAIEVPPDRNEGIERLVRIWEHECLAVDQGDALADWLSEHVSLPIRLVKASGSFQRRTSEKYIPNANPLQFQDGYPIHWLSLESVQELSEKAGQAIPWKSFRPQIVVEGMPPRYEHQIHSGEIAGIPFIDPKPCDRCPVTLIDPETGMVRGKEPLATLSRYKQWRNQQGELKVIFGENMLPLGEGAIAVGDMLIIQSYRNPPLAYGPKA